MTQDVVKQIASLVKAGVPASAIPAILAGLTGASSPKAALKAPVDRLDKIRRTFKKRGFTVTLRDANDPTKPFDVRPFKGWLENGRVVRKGQKGVMGLFHITQTDPLPDKTS